MSATQAGPVVAGRLKSFVERVEKLSEERTAINGDIKDVLSEAKGVGYDVPAIRRLVSYRKMDAADRDERESLDAVYRHALGMAVGAVSNGDMSLREAAKAHGVSKSSVHRALSVPAVSQTPKPTDMGIPASVWHAITVPILEQLAAEEAERAAKEAERIRKRAERLALAQRNAEIDADPLDFPPHLKRKPEGVPA